MNSLKMRLCRCLGELTKLVHTKIYVMTSNSKIYKLSNQPFDKVQHQLAKHQNLQQCGCLDP